MEYLLENCQAVFICFDMLIKNNCLCVIINHQFLSLCVYKQFSRFLPVVYLWGCNWSDDNIIYFRMERQRREDELKGRSTKKGHDAEQSLLNRVGVVFL